MNKLLVIGDGHGKIDPYWKILQKHHDIKSCQVGDFGFKKHHDWFLKNIDSNNHKILFGNHDYYPYLNKTHSHGDFNYDKENGIMYIRGAKSIDRSRRLEGRDWFADEEMSYHRMNQCIDLYEKVKPRIVISHDILSSIKKSLFGYPEENITNKGLETCFNIHRPEKWIFGHYHTSINKTILNTQFICLNELETLILHL